MRSRFVFYDGGAGIMGVRRGNGMVGGVMTPPYGVREGMPNAELQIINY